MSTVDLNVKSEKDADLQACIWALVFLVSEAALSMRLIRDILLEKKIIGREEDDYISNSFMDQEKVAQAYTHIEAAFKEKHAKIMYAILNPESIKNTEPVNTAPVENSSGEPKNYEGIDPKGKVWSND